MNLVGERIRNIRERLGMSQEELGKLCGTTKQTIFKYESGIVTNIPLDRLEKLAEALKVNYSMLTNESAGFWSDRFRTGLKEYLEQSGLEIGDPDLEAAGFDLIDALDVAYGLTGFDFEDACYIADGLGTSIDELLHWKELHS